MRFALGSLGCDKGLQLRRIQELGEGVVHAHLEVPGHRVDQRLVSRNAVHESPGYLPRPRVFFEFPGEFLLDPLQVLATLQLTGQLAFVRRGQQSHPADFTQVHPHRVVQDLRGLGGFRPALGIFGFRFGLCGGSVSGFRGVLCFRTVPLLFFRCNRNGRRAGNRHLVAVFGSFRVDRVNFAEDVDYRVPFFGFLCCILQEVLGVEFSGCVSMTYHAISLG